MTRHRAGWRLAICSAALLAAAAQLVAQSGLPNPYRPVQGLADGGAVELTMHPGLRNAYLDDRRATALGIMPPGLGSPSTTLRRSST